MTRQGLVNKSIDKLNTVKEALELIEILEYDECIAVLTGTKNLPCFTYMHECGKGGRQVKRRIRRIRRALKRAGLDYLGDNQSVQLISARYQYVLKDFFTKGIGKKNISADEILQMNYPYTESNRFC